MKVILIFDQGLAGAGGKSNPNVPLTAEKGGIGSYTMLEPHLKKIGAEVIATLYCGNEYYLNNKEEVITKMAAMAKKLNPDFVVCGPCFNYLDYGNMAANVSAKILEKTDVKSCAMMSEENVDTINEFKTKTPIIKMPKKGGTGLNESIDHLCEYVDAVVNNQNIEEVKNKYCY